MVPIIIPVGSKIRGDKRSVTFESLLILEVLVDDHNLDRDYKALNIKGLAWKVDINRQACFTMTNRPSSSSVSS